MKRGSVFFNNRGMSHHIEMVFSFVIFIGFVFFVLIFVKPYGNDFLTGSVVSGAQYNFMESSEIELVTLFISVDSLVMGGATCFNVELPSEIIGDSYNSSIVRFVDGSVTDSELEGNILKSVGAGDESYYVFLSTDFDDESLVGCVDAMSNVSFGSFRKERVIFVEKLEQMKLLYDSDYELLRQSLAIPDVFDFAVVSEIVTMEKDIPFSSEVFSEDYVEKVLFEDGKVKFIRFSIKLWR